MHDRSCQVERNLSSLQMIYTDFDYWLCRFKEYLSRSSNKRETSVYIENSVLGITNTKENKKRVPLPDENGDFLILPHVIIDSISISKQITTDSQHNKNKSQMFIIEDGGEDTKDFDYYMLKIVNSRYKNTYGYIKCKL